MRQGRFSESQIVAILKEADSGIPTKDRVCTRAIRMTTYYKWKSL